jgi:hypothetical protein
MPTTSTSSTADAASAADPRPSGVIMAATYAFGAVGYALGFWLLGRNQTDAAVRVVALLSVGIVGLLSMVRHSLLHRSDAARMGWDYGRRNNFQIEVGFANLAIGLPAILSAAFAWGALVDSVLVLAYALYFVQVLILELLPGDDPPKERRTRIISMGSQAVILGVFAVVGLRFTLA